MTTLWFSLIWWLIPVLCLAVIIWLLRRIEGNTKEWSPIKETIFPERGTPQPILPEITPPQPRIVLCTIIFCEYIPNDFNFFITVSDGQSTFKLNLPPHVYNNTKIRNFEPYKTTCLVNLDTMKVVEEWLNH